MVAKTLIINLELNRECNFACRYCHVMRADPCVPMDDDEMSRCIEWVCQLGQPVHVFLTGGEPLLSPHLTKWLDATTTCDLLRVSLSTNGSLLTREIVSRLEDARVGMILVSVDGSDAHMHDWHSGRTGSFQATLQGLALLMQSRLKGDIVTNTVVTAANIAHWRDIAALLHSIGVRRAKFSPVLLPAHGLSCPGLRLAPCDIEAFLSIRCELIGLRNESPRLFDQRMADVLMDRRASCLRCFAGRRFIFVRSDGSVFPCWQASDTAFAIRHTLPRHRQDAKATKLYDLLREDMEGVCYTQVLHARESTCLDCCDAFNIYLHEAYTSGLNHETGEPLDV